APPVAPTPRPADDNRVAVEHPCGPASDPSNTGLRYTRPMLYGLSMVVFAAPAPDTAPDRVALKASHGFARKVAANPTKHLPTLIERLTAGTDDPELQARRIHDWIALTVRYDVKGFESGEIGDGGWETTLRTGSAVCGGYAALFDHLAQLAG